MTASGASSRGGNGRRDWERALLAAIDERSAELLELAGALIRIPSENPPGDDPAVSDFIADYLDGRGLAAVRHDGGEGRTNVLATYPGAAAAAPGGRHLALAGHADVVPVGDRSRWDFAPFAGDVVDGWLRGRGASDMKAGLAGVLFVTALLAELRVPLGGPVTFVSVADEETGGVRGLPRIVADGLLAGVTGAVIAEPSAPGNPTIGQKGSCQFELRITGRPGHGSLSPLSGVSANVKAAKAIMALQSLFDITPDIPEEMAEIIAVSKEYVRTREPEDFGAAFDHVTVNIGTVHGGTAINVVADTCVLTVDCRVPFGVRRDDVLAEARRLLAEVGVEAELVERGSRSEANWTPPTDPVVDTLVGAVREVVDPEGYGVLQWATSDARWFRQAGIPVLQYGPAHLPTIHGFNERTRAHQVVDSAKVYALTALRYLDTVDPGSAAGQKGTN
ncbi:M20 family metallopeptidase [Marinitenerispora sediminis]|uniref:Probable succinyl-diaminopimelate desuccinylase n=1 Tax=Marinitenerispora sediminis TaxID=1931232 RepID=A0A368T9G8_9ACTN|nr:ArgE/DapE family deacylase [Marinitenerispora sediminis]RCV54597.1 succinyl-diaminopimelate desuccinylase [Marinitenerispora sediminis]RCV59848.1 succinyl-diaminopimelate desuccinylase [Marinitenerispora sediminis]RCV61175.1 succinyl-diaminopimelate desuccinylase [Marinitenerispora sediminis]